MTKPNIKQPNAISKTDVAIVGGGIAGMASALVLSQCGFSVAIFESASPQNNIHKDKFNDQQANYDDRTLVVNRASIQFWKNTGIWHTLVDQISPIKKVHVSHKGHFGRTVFCAKEFELKALAYIIKAKVLGNTLQEKISNNSNITYFAPAVVDNFEISQELNNDAVTINYQYNNAQLSHQCQLMLAADGVQSGIREKLGLKTLVKSYQSTAIICNLTPEFKHQDCAWEKFTKNGPTALLPFVNNRCGFVWTVSSNQAGPILSLNDKEFINKAQAHFGYKLGRFLKVGSRSSYPLYLVKVPKQVKSRVILIGNAAHSMSPVSAQGLNLSIRDLAHLVDVLKEARDQKIDIGSDQVLQKYQDSIQQDQQATLRYTDDLMQWFKIQSPLVGSIRSIAMTGLDQVKSLKFELYKRASGYRKNTPSMLKYNIET